MPLRIPVESLLLHRVSPHLRLLSRHAIPLCPHTCGFYRTGYLHTYGFCHAAYLYCASSTKPFVARVPPYWAFFLAANPRTFCMDRLRASATGLLFYCDPPHLLGEWYAYLSLEPQFTVLLSVTDCQIHRSDLAPERSLFIDSLSDSLL